MEALPGSKLDEPNAAAALAIDYASKRTLVLEDDPSIREMVVLFLKKIVGVTDITEAKNPEEAKIELEKAKSEGRPFNILITDNDCPRPNAGLEFMKTHGQEFEAIVFSTGMPDETKEILAKSMGAVVLNKPYMPKPFKAAIAEAFTIDKGRQGGAGS